MQIVPILIISNEDSKSQRKKRRKKRSRHSIYHWSYVLFSPWVTSCTFRLSPEQPALLLHRKVSVVVITFYYNYPLSGVVAALDKESSHHWHYLLL